MDKSILEPEQNFDEIIEESRWDLFNKYSDPTDRPIGDDTGYICPAHRWLPLVQEAMRKLAEASALAEAEIPGTIKREMFGDSLRGAGISNQLKRGDPEVRRWNQVYTAAVFIATLADELLNEGRPRQPRSLKLARHRRSDQDDGPARKQASHVLAKQLWGGEKPGS